MTTRAEQAEAAAALVERDLASSGIPAVATAWMFDGVRLVFHDASVQWSRVDEQSDAEVLERVADMVHDYVVEDMWSLGRRSNWPACPEHPDAHPLVVSRVDDDVAWACPRGGATRIPIGHLGER